MTGPRDLLTPVWTAAAPLPLAARDWELLLAQARTARLAARLAELYRDRGWLDAVPPAPRRHLESAARMSERLRRDVRFELDQIRDALHALPTPVVLLKGAAYVAAGLPPARGRLFSDIDILVPRARLAEVEDALFATGWMPEKLSPYDDRYYRRWMHELPPLQHVQRRTSLDVHHTITPPTSRFAIDGAPLLAAAVPLPDDPRLAVLAPADMVLHAAVHLMQEGDFSGALRDVLDIDDLLRHHAAVPGFGVELARRAREVGLSKPLRQVLQQRNRLFGDFRGFPEVAALESALDAGSPAGLTTALLRHAMHPWHPAGDPLGRRVARWLLYVRSHWLRMPWYRIAPHLAYKGWMRAHQRFRPVKTG